MYSNNKQHIVLVQDVQVTSDALISGDVISLAVNTVLYLYHECVVSSPAFPVDQLAAILLSQDKPLSNQKSLASQKSMLNRGPSMLISQKSALSSQKSVMNNQSWSRRSSLQPMQNSSSIAAGSSAADVAAAAALHIEGQQTRLLSIVQLWAQRSRVYHHNKWAIGFARPVVLLSLRALVEKVFTDAFPIWASSVQGAARLKSMDAQLLAWFDPHGFNSSISLLQSLPPAAQQSKGSKQLQRPPQHKRQEFTGTTSLVDTFLTEPKTAQCRRLKRQMNSRSEVDGSLGGAVLNQQQKSALFKAAEQLLLHEL